MGEIINETNPVARKEHQCWWCAEKILKGEKYAAWTYVDSGESPTRVKVHSECRSAWNTWDDNDGEGIPLGMFSRGCHCDSGNCECKKKDGGQSK